MLFSIKNTTIYAMFIGNNIKSMYKLYARYKYKLFILIKL
jgi:hypothetical protein